ncbi:MAG TPA: ester cyclase [Thermoleophilaceae bacterium]
MAEEPRERALRFWEDVFNAHEIDSIGDWVSDDFVNHNALEGTPRGPEGARMAFERMWTAFPDMRFEVEDVIADGNKVACVGHMTGTHSGEFEGMKPTNNGFRARHAHILTSGDEGKWTEHLAIRDDVEMLRQLGVMPGPPGR